GGGSLEWFPPPSLFRRRRPVSVVLAEAAPPLRAVACQRLLDDRQRRGARLELVHFDRLAFELLVVLEEPPQHGETVRRQVGRLVEAVVLWVVHGYGEDLVVLLAAVHH